MPAASEAGFAFVLLSQALMAFVFAAMAARLCALVRTLAVARAQQPPALGLLSALLGGVVPLLNPNPYMPSAIRWTHMIEVGASSFAFGALAALVLRGPGQDSVSST